MKSQMICEYVGDLLDIKTATQREKKYSLNSNIGCYMYFFTYLGKRYVIDATNESGRFGRLINHSRYSPNCKTKVVSIGDTPRLIFIALKDIPAGSEITYDYGDQSKESLVAHPWLKY